MTNREERDVNTPPEFVTGLEFEVPENITDADVIGTVVASDPENDQLTFSITVNDNDLFEITEAGELSLADGQVLDFEAAQFHEITVAVNDSINAPVTVPVMINVTDIVEAEREDFSSFITIWDTTEDGEVITIGTSADINLVYDYTINWGDGAVEQLTEGSPSHMYESLGTYTVIIEGQFPSITMFNSQSKLNLRSIEQWGTIQWQSLEFAFSGCQNMQYNATDVPDLSQITSLKWMFLEAYQFNGDLSGWNVENVENMEYTFYNTFSFLGTGLENWNVENVTNMFSTFRSATLFNGDISNWDMANVTTTDHMFAHASSFNRDLSNWSLINVITMEGMFHEATSFQGNGLASWDVSNVTSMNQMFSEASSFSEDISGWNVNNVTIMGGMFRGAEMFNVDISGWNVGNVESMAEMFSRATSFNLDLGEWNIGTVEDMNNMFDNSGISQNNYSNTLVGWSEQQNIPQDMTLGASGMIFCDEGVSARETLINNHGWSIIGDSECN
ncbi:BspA family leucine-rich repeat surface protein [Muricauda sp. CAU 1633]|uniref:BspA family leucine-rich repeat surface protein n=1 Tax=Allomuricauda sp. CAU 1633 TaxID=2816036 RepID=UPI001A8FCCF1|nr:BspA family leucine-rich repeat surface protein [Muricauda sp. CAU 1633]MBO0322107.1 BspA family leucine-rich repeat surface protein [Muricauda sp. CAU 1633]